MKSEIAYSDIRPKSRAFLRLELPEGQAHGLQLVELADLHCSEALCDCCLATLVVEGLSVSPTSSERWHLEAPTVRLRVDYRSGQIESFEGQGPLAGWISSELLKVKWLAKLRKRAGEVRQWKDPEAWRSADWSHLDPGTMICLRDVLPATPILTFTDDLDQYSCEEFYCWNPECTCTEMLLAILRWDDGVLQGLVRIHPQEGRLLGAQNAVIPEEQLLELARNLLQQLPGETARFAQKATFISQDFGPLAFSQAVAR